MILNYCSVFQMYDFVLLGDRLDTVCVSDTDSVIGIADYDNSDTIIPGVLVIGCMI